MDLIWRSEKIITFGADLVWQFLPFCAICAKFSSRQNLSEQSSSLTAPDKLTLFFYLDITKGHFID